MLGEKSIWLSFDVEATGPCPGIHAMLSIGVVALVRNSRTKEWTEVGEFEANLTIPSDLIWDQDTSRWWLTHPSAYAEHRKSLVDPEEAMSNLCDWLHSIRMAEAELKKFVWVAYPATFDMPFLNYYMHRWASERWVELAEDDVMQRVACFDLGSAASMVLPADFHDVGKSTMPASWKGYKNPHPHVALEDAREQAALMQAIVDEQNPLFSGKVDESEYGVHASHCCRVHGCKYESSFDEPTCPVVLGLVEQEPGAGWCQEPEVVSDPEACRGAG
jgi:hypothetical protein